MRILKDLRVWFAATVYILSFCSFCAAVEIEGLVPIQEIDPTIVLDIRYATENNFTHKKIYPFAIGVLRKETAQKLAAANKEFAEKGYRIKVWDGYRPPSVQKIFWDIMPDDRYVANPYKGGSKHNRGGAVDVTLIDKDGKELEMPSGYDDFSSRAWPNNFAASAQARKNAAYLREVMTKHGFKTIDHEWWHFDDEDFKKFPLVDVTFERFLAAEVKTKLAGPIAFIEIPPVLDKLPAEVKQALIVTSVQDESSQAKLVAWQRSGKGWESVGDVIPAVIGRNGFAAEGYKKEGDGRTPSGIFSLGTAFGYAPSVETGLAYRQATEKDLWVDDPPSPQYNQWITAPTQAKSFEHMKRDDDLYKYGIVVEYNTRPIVAGNGSAIFMHVWRGPNSSTAGCVAMAEENMVQLLRWLDRNQHPVVILGLNP
jgi:D-alanyl-D-alanine dipeptidase